jgi:GR25 family glycosyltransferase involved in LPS biosynthesis
MNKLQNFPSINYISLNTSVERRKKLNNMFNMCNIKRVTPHIFEHINNYNHTIKGPLIKKVEKPALGATTSHLKAWKEWYNTTDEPYTIFCEDDILFDTVQYWKFNWNDFFKSLPKDWECIQLSLIQEILTPVNFRRRDLYDWGANIYLVKRDYVKKVLDIRYPDTVFIFDIFETNLPPVIEHVLYLYGSNVYSFPLFLEDVSVDSTVTPKNTYKQTFNNHIQSYNHVLNWWKTIGCMLNLNEIIVNTKDIDIYTKFALNTEDPKVNFETALHYHNLGQTASAFTCYFRCAERTEDKLLMYELTIN